MKKFLKVVAILAAVVVVLLLIGSAALRVFLPPEKAKALVLKQLTTHLKREVKIESVSVGVLSGLTVNHLKVSESPDFSKGTFIASDTFSIRLSLLPLLMKKVEVSQLILTHPEIQIIRHPDGRTFNFSDLISTAAAKTAYNVTPAKAGAQATAGLDSGFRRKDGFVATAYAAGPEDSSPKAAEPSLQLLVSNAQIHGGIIHFIDRSPAKQSLDISPLDLKLSNVSLTAPFSIQAALNVQTQGIELALALAGEIDLAADSFKIKNCSLTSGDSALTLSGLATQLKSNNPAVNLTLNIKKLTPATLNALAPLPPTLRISDPIVGHAQISGDQAKMNVEMVISLGSLQVTSHGQIHDVQSPQMSVNLHLETNSFPVSDVLKYAGSALPPKLNVKGSTRLTADVSGTLASSHLAAKWEGMDLDVNWPEMFVKPAGVPLDVSFIGEQVQASHTISAQTLTAVLSSLQLTGSGSFKMAGPSGQIALTAKTNTFAVADVARLVPMLAVYKPGGTAVLDIHVSGTPAAPAANGTLSLQNAAARYQTSDLTNVSGVLSFTQQDVSTPKLTGKLDGSDFTVKLSGHKLATHPDVNIDATFAAINLDKLLPAPAASPHAWLPVFVAEAYAAGPPAAFPPLNLTAHLLVSRMTHQLYDGNDLDFKCNLTGITEDLSGVNGTAALRQGAGKIKNLSQLTDRSKIVHIALLPIVTLQKLDQNGALRSLGLPSLDNITFQSIRGDYTLQAGMMNVQTFDLLGQQLTLHTNGTVGLAGAQPLNMKVTTQLAPGSGGALGQWIQDSSGRPTIKFNVTGSVSDPHVKLDMDDAGKKALQEIGGQLLKGLFH